jgi:cytoskeletal protein CcmA (bactofilin family)
MMPSDFVSLAHNERLSGATAAGQIGRGTRQELNPRFAAFPLRPFFATARLQNLCGETFRDQSLILRPIMPGTLPVPSRTQASTENRMSNPYNSASERASILGPTLYFKGDLSAEEDLLIQGRVEGSITHTQRLTVGPQGTVKANIKAQLIIVEGTVDGDLQAEKSVFVKETAKVCGNIYAPTVSIIEGANFSGSIDMDGKKAGQQPGQQPSKFDPVRTPKIAGGAP